MKNGRVFGQRSAPQGLLVRGKSSAHRSDVILGQTLPIAIVEQEQPGYQVCAEFDYSCRCTGIGVCRKAAAADRCVPRDRQIVGNQFKPLRPGRIGRRDSCLCMIRSNVATPHASDAFANRKLEQRLPLLGSLLRPSHRSSFLESTVSSERYDIFNCLAGPNTGLAAFELQVRFAHVDNNIGWPTASIVIPVLR
jgi:hypothetical protein